MTTGFWVLNKTNIFLGPFERLNEARDEARKLGPDIPIYHGSWKIKDNQSGYDLSNMALIQKPKKE